MASCAPEQSASFSQSLSPSPAPPSLYEDFELDLALDAVEDEKREGPWYGPWNIAFKDHLFQGSHTDKAFTITHPQYPVVKTYDTYNPAYDDFAAADDDDDNDDSEESDDVFIRSPGLSPDSGRRRDAWTPAASTPPPEDVEVEHLPESPTPPQGSIERADEDTDSSAQGSPQIATASPPAAVAPASLPATSTPHRRRIAAWSAEGKVRTTRIPDYAQVLYSYLMGADGRPRILRSRVVFLAEIKPPSPNPRRAFIAAASQTKAQASHALGENKELRTIGVITCVGRLWTYVEYHQDSLSPSPTQSERKDGTYSSPRGTILSYGSTTDESRASDSPAGGRFSPDTSFPDPMLNEIFGGASYLRLQDDEGRSKLAFAKILSRLRQINADLWGPP
ncbi:hypothetical protein FA95DRAFT_1605719 [Auriscalpium vulgare]|uniref:Uncharacterized protein n=1 Tax=Auriscalpium vulgare TaxID=40419 RepID=A0ACB8RW70_9AGAM|nr:hypothetical protein FA95DRAFT_1605719 [Auriscalpium vulgare]